MATGQIVDFSNVKEGGNFNKKRIPSGDYLAKVVKIDDAEAKDGVFQYLISIKIEKHASSVFPYYCKLQENQLWKLRNILIAGGLVVPKKRTKVDPNRLLNKLIGVTIEDAEYEGKEQSEIAAVFPAAELGDAPDVAEDGDDDGDEDEPEEAEEPEVEEDEPEDEPEEEVDPFEPTLRASLKAAIKALEPTFQAKKSQPNEDLQAYLDTLSADDDADDAEDEDEDEAPAPVRKVAAKKPASARKTSATVTDEELEELDIDDL